jgi:Holliday junction resolvase-like predicted endonuclease
MKVLKADGSSQPYQEIKVINAIRRAGIPKQLQQKVLDHVNTKIYEQIPTSEIYHHVVEYLDSSSEPFSRAKFSLKQAIMQLGPTGYPFEDFVAKILETQGYTTEVRQIMLGKCVNHEIDIVASKDNKKILIEAKFHNHQGTKSEVHVPLYVKSRFDDVKDKYHLNEAWVITNTKATTDAIAYALCVNMKIISWSYPETESLRDLVESAGLHPITILTSLTLQQKATLLDNHIVLCKDVQNKNDLLDILHLPHDQMKNVLAEVAFICRSEKS